MTINPHNLDARFAQRFNESVDELMSKGGHAAKSVTVKRMLPDRLLVEPEPVEERSVGGIFLPETSEVRTQRSDRGKVLMVGEGPLVAEQGIQVGDVVVVESFSGAGTPVVVDGKPCFIFGADEIMAVLS